MAASNKHVLFYVLGLGVVSLAGEAAKNIIPSYVQMCQVSNPQYNECMLNLVERLRPRFRKGISRMHIPPFEPYELPALEINMNLEALSVKLKVKNIKSFEGSKFVIDNLNVDPEKLTVDLSFTLPTFNVEGDYDIDGRALVVPLRGRGQLRGNLTDVKVQIHSTASVVTTDGVKYVQNDEFSLKMKFPGEFDIKLINTDLENSDLAKYAFSFINQNRKQVRSIFSPIIEETVTTIVEQIVDNMLSHVPYEELFPK